jgi:hypothetical protein
MTDLSRRTIIKSTGAIAESANTAKTKASPIDLNMVVVIHSSRSGRQRLRTLP